ncbi:MAG: sugar phosphate isomerase/epimerase [Acidobacteria bacterium]|nr:sugar phosphate isomerase/epimerase [Acidobacteriota bacterium]
MNRRRFLQALSTGTLLTGCGGEQEPAPASEEVGHLGVENVCFITDEYSQNLDEAIAFAREFGVTQVELRNVDDKYCFLYEPEKLKQIQRTLKEAGLRVAMLDTPILKCIVPGFTPAKNVQDDIAAADPGFPIPRDEQFPRAMEFLNKAIETAKIFETSKIRVFSFWRIDKPELIRPLLIEKLTAAAEVAAKAGMTLCIENENACNLATCEETMSVLADVPPNVGVIWDVLNGEWSGELAYPVGYEALDKARIEHVHLKDYKPNADGQRSVVAVGEGLLPYVDILRALGRDGYRAALSMETHFRVDGSRQEASRRSMRGILSAIEAAQAEG